MTAKDIADKLGLSTATVSLALNNRPGVAESTRQKVLNEAGAAGLLTTRKKSDQRTIELLHYRKNGSRGDTSYTAQIFSSVIEGVENQARGQNCVLMIRQADRESLFPELYDIDRKKVDGILLMGTELSEEQIEFSSRIGIPMILVDNFTDQAELSSISIDNMQGIGLAVSHLVQMGHTDIGYLHVESNSQNFSERYFGFLRAMRVSGLPVKEDNIVYFASVYGGEEAFHELKSKLAKMKHMPTAFVADNDIVAVYTLRALRELGYMVPRDVSLVGFDDIAASQYQDPPLTTVTISKRQMGASAVNQLIGLMNGRMEGIQKTLIRTKLIQRKSVRNMRDDL